MGKSPAMHLAVAQAPMARSDITAERLFGAGLTLHIEPITAGSKAFRRLYLLRCDTFRP